MNKGQVAIKNASLKAEICEILEKSLIYHGFVVVWSDNSLGPYIIYKQQSSLIGGKIVDSFPHGTVHIIIDNLVLNRFPSNHTVPAKIPLADPDCFNKAVEFIVFDRLRL